MKKVSIVIPVYNTEKYLEKCIMSVLNQTYEDIELILVDDGSTDSSACICDNFSRKYNNIKVIHNKNEGVSKARNIGIDNATGDFIMFIDSDDWIDNNMIYKMILFQNDQLDVVKCNSIKNYSNDTEKVEFTCSFEDKIVLKENFKRDIYQKLIDSYVLHTPCAQLINAKIIKENNIKYNTDISYSEDYLFNLRLYTEVESVGFMKDYFYHYLYNLNSKTNDNNIENIRKRCDDTFYVYNYLFEYLNKWRMNNENNVLKVRNRILKEINSRLLSMYKTKRLNYRKERINFLSEIVNKEEFYAIKKNNNVFNILKNKNKLSLFEILLYKKYIKLYDFLAVTLFRTLFLIIK